MNRPTIKRSTLIWMLLGIVAVYVAVARLGGGELVNEAANVFLLAFAGGTVVAYAPNAWGAARQRLVFAHDALATGIFFGWSAVTIACAQSIVWRALDRPQDWTSSSWWGARITLSLFATACHLIAPHAIGGRIPAPQWTRMGWLVAIGLLGTGLVTMAF